MNEKIDAALQTLRDHDQEVGTAAVGPDGYVRIAINGRLLTYEEIYRLAAEFEAKPR